MDREVKLRPVDTAEVTILVDTSVDILLPSTRTVERAPLSHNWSEVNRVTDLEKGFPLQDGRRLGTGPVDLGRSGGGLPG